MIQHPLPHHDSRPADTVIDTIVIHSMYTPDAKDPCDPLACLALLDANRVSPHYSIDRNGIIYQSVDEARRAWHAGVSRMPFKDDARENVNHFSIGIELIATLTSGFSDLQYHACADLCREICSRHPIRSIVGHDQIAPGRKTDPGENFDWQRFREALKDSGVGLDVVRFL